MPTANKLSVIGIGYRPLEKRAREILGMAEAILASSRLAEVFSRYDEHQAVKGRIRVINKVPDTISFIREWLSQSAETHSLVLLASGDPLFFGIGRRICEEFGTERVEILPDLSSVQQAFARIKEPWDDAFLISLHGGPDTAKRRKLPYEVSDIPWLLERHGKMGILTDRENNPAMIAKALHSGPRTPNSELLLFCVCERLGYPEEKIISGSPEEMAGMSFADPNVVILLKSGDRGQESGEKARGTEIRFGLKEEEIDHERGLITKDEVRAVALHKLRLPARGVMWDIGAGSGSVSLEAARLCPGLRIFAIEQGQERIEAIRRNVTALSVPNVEVVPGAAPAALAGLPAPDRVFIGGSGGSLADIVVRVQEQMASGIVVVNCATIETLNDAITALEQGGFSVDVCELSVSRSRNLAGKRRMAALNPVFMVKGEKNEGEKARSSDRPGTGPYE